MGYDRSETAEPMHRLDMDLEVWREVPNGAERRGHGAGRERGSSPVVDGVPIHRGEFLPVERGVVTRDHRPCVSVGGGFASEIAGFEFVEGSVYVVGLEHDGRHNSVVVVGLNSGERRNGKRLRCPVSACQTETNERAALSAGRDRGRPHIGAPDVPRGMPVRHLKISTTADACVYDSTAI